MDFPIQMEAIRIGLSMMYFKGSQVVIPNYYVFLSVGIVFTFTNSVDPDEMQMKCHTLRHFIWVFTVYQSICLGVSSIYKGLFRVVYPVNLCDYTL